MAKAESWSRFIPPRLSVHEATRTGTNGKKPVRLRDVLELLLAQVTDFNREFAFDLLVSIVGNADCALASQRLDASGDVDPVTIDVALVDNYITDIDADAELDPTFFWN
jgi:hypothetical protein